MKKLIEVMKDFFYPVRTVFVEIIHNIYRVGILAIYDVKVRNSGTWFGFLWNFFNPALQILVYWFVFSIGLNTQPPKGEYSYLIWMIMGVIPWVYISEAMQNGMLCIYNFQDVLKRMRFPLSIVPVKAVLSAFFTHVMAMTIVISIFFLSGYKIGVHFLSLFYFMGASFVFLTAFSMLASTITVVFKDFQKIWNSVIRLLFYISPIVWTSEKMPESVQFALKLNPFAYILDGYRESILYNLPFTTHWVQGIYFWGVTCILLYCGCSLHVKLRKRFMDVI